jgi:hypothetical protein
MVRARQFSRSGAEESPRDTAGEYDKSEEDRARCPAFASIISLKTNGNFPGKLSLCFPRCHDAGHRSRTRSKGYPGTPALRNSPN